MEVFVAKQPILNSKEEVVAYELLYRSSHENSFPNIDGDQATADVIINSYLNIGIEELSKGKPCFINFTEKLLQMKLPTYFGPREIVVEILESVQPSEEIIEICKELKQLGYQIALDDCVVNVEDEGANTLFQIADYVKVDFLSTDRNARKRIESLAKDLNIKMIAEKIETLEVYEEAIENGYEFFQGYLFARPTIVSSFDIPSFFFFDFSSIEDLSLNEATLDLVTELIEKDPSLSYKLLKLVNTPFNRSKLKIYSVKQAVMLLGLIEIKKWLHVLSVREQVGGDLIHTKDAIKLSLTRAKMCESIDKLRRNCPTTSAYFTLGMFSMVDRIVGVSMEEIICDLPLLDDLTDALTGNQNHYKDVLDLVTAVEEAEWGIITEKCRDLDIDEKDLFRIYAESLNWSNEIIQPEQQDLI